MGQVQSENPAVATFADELQGLLTDASVSIAEAAFERAPANGQEAVHRNWTIAAMRLQCVEGMVTLHGPGAPDWLVEEAQQ